MCCCFSTDHDYFVCQFFAYKNSVGSFFGSSASSFQCFLWFARYCTVVGRNFLRPNPSSICISFNHNIPSLSAIVSAQFLFCLYQLNFYSIFYRSFRSFISSFILLYSLNILFTKTNLSVMSNIQVD